MNSGLESSARIGVLLAAMFATACGDTYPSGHSEIYSAIIRALIADGRCISESDCNKKQLVFGEGGGGRAIYFSVYETSDESTIVRVTSKVSEEKRKAGIVSPITLAFFVEKKVDSVNKSNPPDAAFVKEIR